MFFVELRFQGNNRLTFGAMPQKIPSVWGQSPQGSQYRIQKLSDFRIGYLAFPSDGRSLVKELCRQLAFAFDCTFDILKSQNSVE
jgi:hypothetical protein